MLGVKGCGWRPQRPVRRMRSAVPRHRPAGFIPPSSLEVAPPPRARPSLAAAGEHAVRLPQVLGHQVVQQRAQVAALPRQRHRRRAQPRLRLLVGRLAAPLPCRAVQGFQAVLLAEVQDVQRRSLQVGLGAGRRGVSRGCLASPGLQVSANARACNETNGSSQLAPPTRQQSGLRPGSARWRARRRPRWGARCGSPPARGAGPPPRWSACTRERRSGGGVCRALRGATPVHA